MGILFEVGDHVVETIGAGEDAKRVHTTIRRIITDRTVQTATGNEYDRLTGAKVEPGPGYRAIHTAEKYRAPGKHLQERAAGVKP